MTGVSIHGTGMTTDDVIKKAHDTLPVATSSAAGVVKIGDGVSVTGDGTISVSGGGDGGGSYTLPVATGSVLGGVKIGSGVSVTGDGTISVAGGGGVPVIDGQAVVHGPTDGGTVLVQAGDEGASGSAGDVVLFAGTGVNSSGGNTNIRAGSAVADDVSAGAVNIYGGFAIGSGNTSGGDISLTGGDGTTNGHGGSISLWPGSGAGTGASGHIILHVPSSDPHVNNALWNDGGTLKISAG